MDEHRQASNCRWSVPTIFLEAPFWYRAEDYPWSCIRDAMPRFIETTDHCATCPMWKERTATDGEPQGLSDDPASAEPPRQV